MHDQYGLAHGGDACHQAMLGDIVEEFARDREGTAGQRNLDLALFSDVLDPLFEEAGDMLRIGGRGDGDDGLGLRDLTRGREDRSTSEAMPDQERGRLARFAQMIGGAKEVGYI